MKFSFLAQRNIVNAAVVTALLMPTMAFGGTIIAKDSDPSSSDVTEGTTAFIMTTAEMTNWLATTDAELTFIGDSTNALSLRSADSTTVTYCSSRVDDLCGGSCTVYTGGATCLNAPNTNCLAATNNVGFCSSTGCTGACNQLSSCGTHLSNGFCYTPGTKSIAVGTA